MKEGEEERQIRKGNREENGKIGGSRIIQGPMYHKRELGFYSRLGKLWNVFA